MRTKTGKPFNSLYRDSAGSRSSSHTVIRLSILFIEIRQLLSLFAGLLTPFNSLYRDSFRHVLFRNRVYNFQFSLSRFDNENPRYSFHEVAFNSLYRDSSMFYSYSEPEYSLSILFIEIHSRVYRSRYPREILSILFIEILGANLYCFWCDTGTFNSLYRDSSPAGVL